MALQWRYKGVKYRYNAVTMTLPPRKKAKTLLSEIASERPCAAIASTCGGGSTPTKVFVCSERSTTHCWFGLYACYVMPAPATDANMPLLRSAFSCRPSACTHGARRQTE